MTVNRIHGNIVTTHLVLCSQLCDLLILCLDPQTQITNINILDIIYRHFKHTIKINNLLSPIPIHVVIFSLFSGSSPTGAPSLCTHR
jgi:hypothetical protein